MRLLLAALFCAALVGVAPAATAGECGLLICPTPTPTPAPVPTPPPPVAVHRTATQLTVSDTKVTPDERVWFTIVRLYDDGDGRLVRTDGKVMLQEKVHGAWRTVQGSRVWAPDGRARLWYNAQPGRLKIRAKTVGPVSYSPPVVLFSHA